MDPLYRLLSHLWPIRVRRVEGRHGPLELVWENGRLVLNSARANQSFGPLHTLWQRSFRSIELRERDPGSVLMLGLGTGSVISILRDELGHHVPITAVEHDPVVIALASEPPFSVDARKDLVILEADALAMDPRITGPFGLVAVDLFEDRKVPAGLADPGVLAWLAGLIGPGGDLLVNTMADDETGVTLRVAVEQGLTEAGLTMTTLRPLPENHVLHGRRPS